jgi:hypothetical protein
MNQTSDKPLPPVIAEGMEKARKTSRFATPEDAFRWLRVSGLEVRDWKADMAAINEAESQRPLVNRCQCGKVISPKWIACKACVDAELQATAALITTQEAFEAFLGDFAPEEREEICTLLAPYMQIEMPS